MEKCRDPGRHPWIFNRSGFRLGFSSLILVPFTLILVVSFAVYQWSEETNLLPAIASGLLVSIMPQLGYAFGLVTRAGVLMPRVPRKTKVTFWQGAFGHQHLAPGNPTCPPHNDAAPLPK